MRVKYHLKGWNEHLEGLTGIKEDELPYISNLETPLKERSINTA